MIDGYVILRSIINLRRVNEVSQAERKSHETSPNAISTENASASSKTFDNNLSNLNTTMKEFRECIDEENMNSSISSISNGLDTVNKEDDDDLEETCRKMLRNTNINSLNLKRELTGSPTF
ncbi:hypothetical protein ILUMI_00675 [Ignelater luminosus]|uniref:Uncharacterized protein n=1 Tax=Ignelater luminosus TaxID=2038154 RepID=A0A8K0DJY5_IGNLU|nr:hypothetical protein ILUMI_00675 [Ignelater luminosus]